MTPNPSTPDDEQSERSDFTWCLPWNWPWGIRVLLIAFGIMLLPFGIRALMLSGVPAMDELPEVTALPKWDVLPEEAAFTDYRLAAGLHERIVADLQAQSRTVPDTYDVVTEKGWIAADEPLKEWLELHREALSVWKRGTAKREAMERALDQLEEHEAFLPEVQEQRTFARFALLEEARCIHEGRLDEAWQWTRAINRCGGHTSRRGGFGQGMVAMDVHAMSTAGMARWAEEPGVTSEQLKAALSDVRSDDALYESESNILKAEYLAGRNSLTYPNWAQWHIRGEFARFGSRFRTAAIRTQFWVTGEPDVTIRMLRQVLANQISEVDKPLPARRKLVGSGVAMLFDPDPAVPLATRQLDPAGIDRMINRSTVTLRLLPELKRFDSAMLRRAAQRATIEALLAAQAYRRDHGEFPETLSQLVPDYMDAVPLDSFQTGGGPLHYRRDGPTAVVWSVGIDGSDDGGDVEVTNQREADTGFRIRLRQSRQGHVEPENEQAAAVNVEQLQ